MVGIDAIFFCIVPHEPDRSMNVLLDLRNRKFRLRTVNHREQCVTSVQIGPAKVRIDRSGGTDKLT